MQKRTAQYAIGLVVIVALIALVAFVGKRAVAPADMASNSSEATPSSTPVADETSTSAPVQPVSPGYMTIHVKRGGPTVWWTSPTTTVSSEIQLSNPPLNTIAISPMTVSGQVRGSWFFEASMPIFLTDAKGKILAQSTVKAQSDWMTDGFVPFLGKLTFPRQPTGSNGVFIIKNDNPSGMASKDKRMEVLVLFN